MWKYTGKGDKRSPAQQRQNHLFMRKGQITAMVSVLSGIVGDELLSKKFRTWASIGLVAAKAMAEDFDREVGWK